MVGCASKSPLEGTVGLGLKISRTGAAGGVWTLGVAPKSSRSTAGAGAGVGSKSSKSAVAGVVVLVVLVVVVCGGWEAR